LMRTGSLTCISHTSSCLSTFGCMSQAGAPGCQPGPAEPEAGRPCSEGS
jgi:hypothetical protein